MTRIKLLAISAITTIMILGSTIVLAMDPVDQADQAGADAADVTVLELAQPGPAPRRGGGGAGMHLRK